MIAETTDFSVVSSAPARLLYDADCRFCCAIVARCHGTLERHRITPMPLQTPWVWAHLQQRGLDPLAALRCLEPGGRLHSGDQAVRFILRRIRWTRPVSWLWWVPGATFVLSRAYAVIARHRHCHMGRGACRVRGDR